MARYIETHPEGFVFLIPELFKKYGKLIIEAPDTEQASFLSGALNTFDINSVLFSPQLLLLERGGTDVDAQTAYSKIIEQTVDVLIVTSVSAKLKIPEIDKDEKIIISKGENYKITEIVKMLITWGYRKVSVVREPGDFALRGDILDVGLFSSARGVRFEFFDDEIEKVQFFSTASQRNIKDIDRAVVPKLLFSSVLRDDWKDVLEKKAENLSMKEILDAEEIINSGGISIWDMFPLFTGDRSICDAFDGTFIRWEETKGESYFNNTLEKLENERNKRVKEGNFLPFNVSSSFGNIRMPEIKVSEIFSSAEKIEKFRVNHIRIEEELKTDISAFFQKLKKEDKTILFFSKPNEIDFFIDEAEENDVELLHVEKIPDISAGENFFLVENKPWFDTSTVLSIPEKSVYLVSSEILRKHSSVKTSESEHFEIVPEQRESLNLETLTEGDFVVHYNFGIGVYEGIEKVNSTDCIVLKYDKEDKLYVPVYNMHFIYRYKYEEGYFPRISSLRTTTWEITRNKAKKEIEKVAENILQLYAERSVERTESMEVNTEIYREFSSRFPYRLTKDQATSIAEVESDLSGEKIVDRLLCGDVGFGKTEVAMRGCMIVAANGKQCAILTPTTVLAFQHFRTFSKRFEDLPVKIEMLSRFNSPLKQKEVIKELKEGKIDVVIGTHRLLSKDVEFKDLGFLVVDEEHRFGVSHKERIKDVRKGVASLSMTATPIPRTLQMSLLGIRKVSFIKTPPGERKSTVTFVLDYSDEIVKEAILSELSRNGQIYFVHNRISSLQSIKQKMESMIKGIRIGVAHGKMDEKELENVMVSFVNREYDVLLSTTLIESGIDIPLVNTIIIDRADTFGLAQLYQLRGRVGRWNREARAYLFVPNLKNLTPDAYSRLSVIKRFDYLGSGYDVATEDLNIRGGGNILGFKQSGKLRGVGNDLYLDLLRKRIEELQNGVPAGSEEFEISSDIDAYIPEDYISDGYVRVGFYRRLSELRTLSELSGVRGTLREMFGKIPPETENLLFLTSIKLEALKAGAYGIIANRNNFTLKISSAFVPQDMEQLFRFVEKHNGKFIDPHSVSFEIKGVDEINGILEDFKGIKVA
jgi:transcription-repair coupling factor (superfamily II helicase)